MTNYNERLDEILAGVRAQSILVTAENSVTGYSIYGDPESALVKAKQAITSLIKELVEEAKPYRETIIDKWNKDRADEVKATNAAMNAWADIYEQNLLKALEQL